MIKEQAIKGVKWTTVASVAGNILQFLQLIIVSKFISATDYGLMSLTLVITYFAQFLGDMGISNAIIYKKEINRIVFSSLFWLSLLCCWVIFLVLFFTAPLLSSFFNEIALNDVIRITSLLFIALPLQLQYLSLLRKGLQFDKIAIAEIISKMAAFIIAVILAIRGYGVFSLVYSTLIGIAVSTLLYCYFGWKEMTIGFILKKSAVLEYLHFGVYQTGNDILSYFNFYIDTILLGKLTGVELLGYYSFAKNLAIKPVQIINPIIGQVAFPLMAKVNDNVEAVKKIYLKVLHGLATINFLVYPFVAACAENIVSVFFGNKWLPAAPALQALSLFCMIRAVFNPVGILLSARGLVKRLFYWNLSLLCIVPVLVFISVSAGIVWVAITLSMLLVILFFPMWKWLVFPATHASFNEFWNSLKSPLINSFLIYLALCLLKLLPISNPLIRLSASLLIWLFAGYLVTKFINKAAYDEMIGLVKPLGQRKKLMQ